MAAAPALIITNPWVSKDTKWLAACAATPIRLLAVEEQPLVREGLVAIIESQPEMKVIAQASTGREAIDQFRRYRPDIVTLDLLLPDIPGDEVARRILSEFRDARVVVVTAARGDVQLHQALEAGVKGIVLKGMQKAELLDVIRQVRGGRKVIPRQVASTLAEHLGDEVLTAREIQVLRLVAQGFRNKQVAANLYIAEETVRMHMKNILGKLAARDRTHAVTIALARGVFQL